MNTQSPYFGMPFEEVIDIKRARRMAKIDAFDPAIRSLINDYGYHVVNTIYELGITKPGQIRHIVETVLDEFSPTRGSESRQGARRSVLTTNEPR